jgi:hypothetical protein
MELAAGLPRHFRPRGEVNSPLQYQTLSVPRKMYRGLDEGLRGNLRDMNQREAVIEAMRTNGGYATLGELYKRALKVPGVSWETKTPFKSINRIVQISK